MKILLTGKTGQVGYELKRSLQGVGHIIAIGRHEMDLADLNQVREVIRTIRPDLIINAAAYTDVDKAETEPDLVMRINGEAPGVMAEEALRLGAAMIHYSTDYVFDGAKRGLNGELVPYKEGDPPNALNIYGKTKLAGERAIAAGGCPYLILRTSWVYSTYGKNFLLTMLRLANERHELKVVDDQWGSPTWVRWIATATAQIVKGHSSSFPENDDQCSANATGKSSAQTSFAEFIRLRTGIYNFTSANATTWKGFADEIFLQATKIGLLDKAPPAIHGIGLHDYATPAKRPINSMLNLDALSSCLGMKPPTWQSSLAECISSK
jgi:dTDP-4-dehydrorhamnose reductase